MMGRVFGKSVSSGVRHGFTLVEVLVTLLILSVLMGAVFPVVIKQIDRWGALRVARDLTHMRTSVLEFHADVRNHPLQLTQTIYSITTSDIPLWNRSGDSTPYDPDEVERWNGPYLDESLVQALGDNDAFRSGLGVLVGNQVFCVDISGTSAAPGSCEKGEWVGLYMHDVRIADFSSINDFIDPGESDLSWSEQSNKGRLRFSSYGSIAESSDPGDVIYLAMPYLVD